MARSACSSSTLVAEAGWLSDHRPVSALPAHRQQDHFGWPAVPREGRRRAPGEVAPAGAAGAAGRALAAGGVMAVALGAGLLAGRTERHRARTLPAPNDVANSRRELGLELVAILRAPSHPAQLDLHLDGGMRLAEAARVGGGLAEQAGEVGVEEHVERDRSFGGGGLLRRLTDTAGSRRAGEDVGAPPPRATRPISRRRVVTTASPPVYPAEGGTRSSRPTAATLGDSGTRAQYRAHGRTPQDRG